MKSTDEIQALAQEVDAISTLTDMVKPYPCSIWARALETPDVAEYIQKAINALSMAQQLCVDESSAYYNADCDEDE